MNDNLLADLKEHHSQNELYSENSESLKAIIFLNISITSLK